MSFCKKCGIKLDDDALFCPSCGTPVIKTKKSTKGNPDIEPEQDNLGGTALHTNLVYGKINIENLPENFEIDNRYIVKQKLGQGSFGAVYRVFDKDLETEKALKIIPEAISNDHEAMMSLRKEAAIMVKLNHPHIVRVYDFHHTGDIKYIDMEYVQGENLADIKLKKPEHKFIEKEVRDYALQIIEALAYAHNKKVIHKDIKPQNIMLNNSGEIKLMDFGIAETVHSSMSRLKNTGSSGTLVYMSPEQLRGKDVGREADIYSLGATLYELLSGNPPFYQGDITYQIINEQVADLNHVSKNINAIIQKCLAKDKAKRFSDCDELRKAFLDEKTIENEIKEEEIITEKEIIEPQQTYEQIQDETTTIQKKKKSYEWLIIFLFIILALIIFGIVYNNNKREQEIVKQQETEQQQLEQEQKDKETEKLAEQQRQEEQRKLEQQRIEQQRLEQQQKDKEETEKLTKQQRQEQQRFKIKMVFVKGGTFQMGSNKYDDEKPIHTVTISDFYIGKYEVTQKQWKEIMGNNPSRFKGNNLPVEKVSWNDVQNFLQKFNAKTGENYRLPTEAEWEYAARGGNKSNAYKYSGSNNISDVAWYDSNSGNKTHNVGTKQANELGIYDMSGNVWEWCSDWYGKNYYSNSSQYNPQGPSSGSSRVYRGGGWYDYASCCRVAYRYYWYPDYSSINLGFRRASGL